MMHYMSGGKTVADPDEVFPRDPVAYHERKEAKLLERFKTAMARAEASQEGAPQ